MNIIGPFLVLILNLILGIVELLLLLLLGMCEAFLVLFDKIQEIKRKYEKN